MLWRLISFAPGELGGILKKAMADTNLAVKLLALGIICKVAAGMGQPFEKHSRLLTAPVASMCADQKATTRTAALGTLAAIADAIGGLNSMFAGLASSLENPNPALRASVLGWIAERLLVETLLASGDMTTLAGPIISCLEDRNGDVRKSAGAVLPFVVASAGFEYVMDQTSKLKPASRATIIPLINNARNAASASSATGGPAKAAATSTVGAMQASHPPAGKVSAPNSPARGISLPSKSTAPPARSLAMKALSSVPTSRPASSLSQSDDRSTGLPKPRAIVSTRPTSAASYGQSTAASNTESSSSRPAPFTTTSSDARAARVKKDAVKWILDASSRRELSEYLAIQMEPHTSPELFALLFSKDHRAEEDFMTGLTTLAEFYDNGAGLFGMAENEVQAIQLANVDLALKYSALQLLSNNTQLANRCLEVMRHVVETLPKYNERFSDAEAKLFVPALIFKVCRSPLYVRANGCIIQLSDAKFGHQLLPIFESLDKVIAGSQVVQLLVQYGLEDKSAGKTCKNESLQLIEKAYKKRGSILRTRNDRAFYEAIANCISDSGTRNAALSVMA